jgi:cytochrome b561
MALADSTLDASAVWAKAEGVHFYLAASIAARSFLHLVAQLGHLAAQRPPLFEQIQLALAQPR